ncbi:MULTISPECIES: type VI secretion system-associated protein TagF [Burkholderia]|uniref:type VI secretion system-associated protein TagF n=1 Tax=Burkholderia TaxID=32008 RepID=UPI0012E38809|nr:MULTISPECIES: type VI secretion system-associated protein TagF [Burkholderia]
MPSEAMSRLPPLTRADGDAPAWYGKIPGAGDFVNSRLPHALAQWWERWLQQGMAAMRQRGPDEIARHYTVAPVWNFLVPAGAGASCVQAGCLAPSCDRVGRYYPVIVTLPMPAADYWNGLPDAADAFYWQIGHALLDAIRHARAPVDLEETLDRVRLAPGGGPPAEVVDGMPATLPERPALAAWPGLSGYFDPHGGTSFWWTNRADGSPLRTHAHTGAPDNALFLTLFGGS